MKFHELLRFIRSDLFRYSGNSLPRSFLKYYIFSPGFHYSYWMRMCKYFASSKGLRYFVFPICWLYLYSIQIKFGFQISYKTSIGAGLLIGHFGGIVISPYAIIGDNCNLSHQVTIGVVRRGDHIGAPTIGNNVYIGPGAKIIGNIKVGNYAAIGANCVVTKDVPDYGVVVGVPGKLISSNGSSSYINNTFDF